MTVVMTEKEINEAVKSLANDVSKSHPNLENVVLVGVHSNGFPLANRIAAFIKKEKGVELPIGKLDVSLYKDDVSENAQFVTVEETDIPFDISGKQLILVEDVLFHGKTIKAALQGLLDFGRPEVIELAVLVDRGNRELPIQSTYSGKVIKTKKEDQLDVFLYEVDGEDKVIKKDET